MNIEFYIHGVPKGFDYVGPEAERAYFSTFYSANKGERTKLTLEHRHIDSHHYCYYNYLKYHNITDADQRKGAYFGMSLRMDYYYADITGMLDIFNLLFSKFILHNIITENGDSMKYEVSQFKQKKDVIDKLQATLVQMLQSLLSPHQLFSIADVFGTTEGNAEVCLFDYDRQSVLQMLKTHSKISLSADIPSRRERELTQQFNSRLAQLKASKEQELERLRQMVDEQEKELSELRSAQITTKTDTIKADSMPSSLSDIFNHLKNLLGK